MLMGGCRISPTNEASDAWYRVHSGAVLFVRSVGRSCLQLLSLPSIGHAKSERDATSNRGLDLLAFGHDHSISAGDVTTGEFSSERKTERVTPETRGRARIARLNSSPVSRGDTGRQILARPERNLESKRITHIVFEAWIASWWHLLPETRCLLTGSVVLFSGCCPRGFRWFFGDLHIFSRFLFVVLK